MDTEDLINTRVEYVRLTNNLPCAFTDRYDGVPFTVAPGKSENFPVEVAAHFFGYDPDPAAMMRHMAKRQGWNTPDFVKINEESGKNKAQEFFDLLKIERVVYKLTPVEDIDPREPIPADPEVPQEVASAPKSKTGSKQKTA